MHWCAKFGLSDRCQHSLGETAAVPYSYKMANLRSRDVTYIYVIKFVKIQLCRIIGIH